jgi:hypothetical protein
MTTETTQNETTAATVGAQGVAVAPGKRPAKNLTTGQKSARKGANAAKTAGATAKPRKAAEKAAKSSKTAKTKPEGVREGSKTATILDLLRRPKGATLAEIMEASSWQAHSVRGFISGTLGKKMGLNVTSEKREDGIRVYSIHK